MPDKKYFQHLLLFISLSLSCKKEGIKSPPQNGLIASIALDGKAVDEVSGLTGTSYHTIPFIDHHGKVNGAMYFNSVDSAYIDFGDAVAYSFTDNIFSISCWVMVDDTTKPITILSKRSLTGPFEYSLDNHMNKDAFNFDNWIDNGGTTVYGTDPLNAAAPIRIHQWQNIVVVADGIGLKVYLDGLQTREIDTVRQGNFFLTRMPPFKLG